MDTFSDSLKNVNISNTGYLVPLGGILSDVLSRFLDTSEKAYDTVCYLVISNSGRIASNLVFFKIHAAAIKIISMSDLELLAAVELAKIIDKAKSTCTLKIYYWTDFTMLLSRIRSDPDNDNSSEFVINVKYRTCLMGSNLS